MITAIGAAAACTGNPPPMGTCAPFDAGSPVQDQQCASYDAIVATTDYVSSAVGLVSLTSSASFVAAADLGADPVLATSAGRYFWIARDFGDIIEVDPSCLHAKATYHVNDDNDGGGSSNPQDVAVAPDGSLWVVRFASHVATLLVLSPDGCGRRTFDLSSLDPVDHNSNASSIKILDPGAPSMRPSSMKTSKAYVALGMLNADLSSTRPSQVVRIDLETGAVEDRLELKGRNPIGLMDQVGSQLYLADAGSWHENDPAKTGAAIEVVDTASFTSKVLVNDVTLGGHAVQVSVTDGCGVAVVAGAYDEGSLTSLIRFDPESGTVPTGGPLIPTTTGFDINGLAWLDGRILLVGDRSSTSGGYPIHVFDKGAPCTLTERKTPLLALLPPVGIFALH
jgi:hypothetical protein